MKRIALNEGWHFAKLPDGEYPAAEEPARETVTLPHTWYSDDDQYHGLAVYCKTVPADQAWQKVFLEFEGADQTCRVLVNGEEIGEHKIRKPVRREDTHFTPASPPRAAGATRARVIPPRPSRTWPLSNRTETRPRESGTPRQSLKRKNTKTAREINR